MRALLIAGSLLLGVAQADATPLSKDDHAFLAQKTMEGCLTGQARQAANMNITVGKLQDFCTCFGEGLTATITMESLERDKGEETPEMTKASDAAFKSCAASTFKK